MKRTLLGAAFAAALAFNPARPALAQVPTGSAGSPNASVVTVQGISGGTGVPVTGTFWQATQPVSASSLPLPSGAATFARQPTNASIGSTTSGQTGNLHMGAVTKSAPSYTSGQTDPLSLTAAGALRVDGSGVTQPVSLSAVTAAGTSASSGLPIQGMTGGVAVPVSAASLPLPSGAATAANQANTQGSPTGGTAASNSDLVGGIYHTSLPTLTNGQQAGLQLDSSGRAIVNCGSGCSAGAVANMTPTDCSGSIATGGTAQNAFTAQTTLHGFIIKNIDASTGGGEPLWISFTRTAAANTAGSYPLGPPATSSFAGGESFATPPGLGTNHALSVISATTGHNFSCTWW